MLQVFFTRVIISRMNDIKTKCRGRPKFENPRDKRDKRLPVVQVSETELNAYKAASERAGITFSAWVRDKLDKASK